MKRQLLERLGQKPEQEAGAFDPERRNEILRVLQERLLAEQPALLAQARQDARARTALRDLTIQILVKEGVILSGERQLALAEEMVNEIAGFGPIEPLIRDPAVTEVMVNGPYQVFVERSGRLLLEEGVRFRDAAHLDEVIQRIISPLGRRLDVVSPYVDARLPDGSRVHVIAPPVAINGPYLTIRKFRSEPLTLAEMCRLGSLTQEMHDFLEAAVRLRLNCLISGGTSSGKTTTLNALVQLIPSDSERIVTIEDAAELRLKQRHVVSLEARPANIEGRGAVSIRELVRNALRMRPDRIIVGETRGAEAFDMLQAMNTGHPGSLTTVHANSPRDALERLADMVLMANEGLPHSAVVQQIASAIDLVVHQERQTDGLRRITHVVLVSRRDGDWLLRPILGPEFAQDGSSQVSVREGPGRLDGLDRVERFLNEWSKGGEVLAGGSGRGGRRLSLSGGEYPTTAALPGPGGPGRE